MIIWATYWENLSDGRYFQTPYIISHQVIMIKRNLTLYNILTMRPNLFR